MLSEQFSSLAFSIALSTYSLSSTSMIVWNMKLSG
ncbi:Uncharacterised protein [Segatella copri]|nr:Uncharacterised protein [Segatella copri]